MEPLLIGLRSALLVLFLASAWSWTPQGVATPDDRAKTDRMRLRAWRLMAAAVLLGGPVHFHLLGVMPLSDTFSRWLQLALMLCWLGAVLLVSASRTLWNGGSRRGVTRMLVSYLIVVGGFILGAEFLT
jgi:hypothetical protein